MARAPKHPFLRDYQAATLLSLFHGLRECRGETFTVLFPRQAGKNEVSAALVSALLLANGRSGGSIVVCAPTFVPQGRISLERTWRALTSVAPITGIVPQRQDNAIVAGRASAVFLSASPEAHSAGHTASIALIADEAQDINADWFDRQFRPMAASTGASTVLFGTPWDGETLLDRAVARNREGDVSLRQLHFEVDWHTVAQAVPEYGEYVRAERERLGAGHPLFRTQYALEVAASAGRLFSAAQLAGLAGHHERLPGPRPGERYVAGLDIAGEKSGRDASVLTIGRLLDGGACEVVDIVSWDGAEFATLESEVERLARHWGVERLAADGTGVGDAVVAHLRKALPNIVAPFRFTTASKTRMGYDLIAAAETGRLRLFADDAGPAIRQTWQELRDCGATPSGSGRLAWGNQRGHDDFVVSLGLCLHAAREAGAPRVARGRGRLA